MNCHSTFDVFAFGPLSHATQAVARNRGNRRKAMRARNRKRASEVGAE